MCFFLRSDTLQPVFALKYIWAAFKWLAALASHACVDSSHTPLKLVAYSVQPCLVGMQAGPEGCGKATLLDYCFSRLPGKVTVARVHCSAQTTADHVIQKLLQV